MASNERYDPVRKERFVEALCLGHEAISAARVAGFKGNLRTVARKLNDDPEVRAMLDAHRAEMREQYRFDRDKAVRMLMDSFAMAQSLADPRTMVTAVRELNEMHGHHAPRQVHADITHKGEGVRLLAELTDQELLEAFRAGNEVIDGEFEQVSAALAAPTS